MKELLTQIPLNPGNGFTLPGRLGDPTTYIDPDTAGLKLGTVITMIIGVMTTIAFIWFTILLFMGALQYLTSGGDPKGIEGATAKIRAALIGLVIVISAIFFIQLIGTIFGFNILDIQDIFTSLVEGDTTKIPPQKPTGSIPTQDNFYTI